MADSTINGLTALTGANVDNTADQFAIWDNSDNTTKKITRTEVLTGVAAGTAAAPAISFAGDPDTGIFSGAANSFSISTGGSERVYVHTNGQVRLGYAGAVATPTLASTTDVNTGFYFPAADNFGLVTGGVEAIRINSTQQVGISKTPTLGLLDVDGDAYFNTVRVGLGGGGVASNTAVGNGAMAATATGASNTAVGNLSMAALTTGTENVSVGRSALATNTTGSYNTAIGRASLSANLTGSNCTAVGHNSLSANTASDNTAVGFSALTANTSGTDNVALGRSALAANVTANNNTAIGRSALSLNTSSDNTAVGALALQANTSGTNNVAVGRSALAAATTAGSNTAVGRSALASTVTNGGNTAIGRNALTLVQASDNTAVGDQAGDVLTTGANNTIIGSGADASANNGTGQIVIGKGVTGTANNRITVGITTNIAELDLDGVDTSWAASSDERLKKNVADYAAGLDVITALRPVTYQWRSRKEVPTELTNYYADSDEPVHGDASKTYHGFIAQEVKAVLDANPSVPNGQHLWEQRDDGVQTLAPADLVPILVNAIKQLHAEVQALKNA